MKKSFVILMLAIAALISCEEDVKVRTSGTDTIDNFVRQEAAMYYVYGFSFSQGKLVATIYEHDIALIPNRENILAELEVQNNNFLPSFLLVGEYSTEEEAQAAFDNLKTVPNGVWIETIKPVEPNQVWAYRSKGELYTKIRIVKVVNEIQGSIVTSECTFQWVHQPDGSKNFQ